MGAKAGMGITSRIIRKERVRAWDIVLGRLEDRFAEGPLDWEAPLS